MYPFKGLNSFSAGPVSLEDLRALGMKSDQNDDASLPQASSTEG